MVVLCGSGVGQQSGISVETGDALWALKVAGQLSREPGVGLSGGERWCSAAPWALLVPLLPQEGKPPSTARAPQGAVPLSQRMPPAALWVSESLKQRPADFAAEASLSSTFLKFMTMGEL